MIAWTLLYLPRIKLRDGLNKFDSGKRLTDLALKIESNCTCRREESMWRVLWGEIFGQRVQKGIAARVLEYANELSQKP